MSISLCMIVKNEEAMLSRCLESVQHIADEMVIVDTGSSDGTKDIARSFGAAVYDYDWNDSFADARNFALGKAAMEWILLMDADDAFEAEDTGKLFELLVRDNEANVYYFQTLSYMGDVPDKSKTISNMNVRLVRNRHGYLFKGDIHEQLVNNSLPESRVGMADIRIYHYGYLNSVVESKQKRERNMALIRKELDKEPDNPFMLCNMGNECYSLRQFEEALCWYLKSWEQFDSRRGFSSKMLIRIISCCELLGKTQEQQRFIEEGLKYYPDFTDLEFIRASDYLRRKKYAAAIRSFKKCLKMGEPPLLYSYAGGVGSYKTQLMLMGIYEELGDKEEALKWGRAAIKSNPDFTDAYMQLGRLMLAEGKPVRAVKAQLTRLALPARNTERYLLLSDIFYTLRQYDTALAYVQKARESNAGAADRLDYNEGACLLHLRRFRDAAVLLQRVTGGENADKALLLYRLCALLDSGVQAQPRGEGEWFEVMSALEKIERGILCRPLAMEAETSQAYIGPIFGVLELLLQLGEFDLFDRARQLLNLVTDDTVLLRLGKLYFRYSFGHLAFSELARSLSLTGHIDAEALDIMKQCLPVPQP